MKQNQSHIHWYLLTWKFFFLMLWQCCKCKLDCFFHYPVLHLWFKSANYISAHYQTYFLRGLNRREETHHEGDSENIFWLMNVTWKIWFLKVLELCLKKKKDKHSCSKSLLWVIYCRLTFAMKDQLDYKPTRRRRGITIRKSSQISKTILSVARIQGNAIHFCGLQGEN